MRLSTLLFGLTALACGKTSVIAADDTPDGSAGSAGSGAQGGGAGSGAAGGAGGSGGSAGSAGSAGGGGSGGLDLTHFHACELPTGALRYGVYKADPARDLCFLLVVGSPSSEFSSIQVSPATLGVEHAHVWQGAATCGDYPQPTSGAVSATAGSGVVSITYPESPPPLVDLDVTLTFPQTESWVPATEVLDSAGTVMAAYDCASCDQRASAYATLIQTTVKPGGGPNGCTSVVRLDYVSKKPLWHTVVCDFYDATTEAEASATVDAEIGLAPGFSLLSGPSNDQWLFRGVDDVVIPEADRIVAAVSVRTGSLTFAGRIAWFGTGAALAPASFEPGSEIGGGCPARPKPLARGFTAGENPKKVELDAPEVDQVMDAVWATAIPRGIELAWGNTGFDAMVIAYPKTLGFDPAASEYVVLVNHGWLE